MRRYLWICETFNRVETNAKLKLCPALLTSNPSLSFWYMQLCRKYTDSPPIFLHRQPIYFSTPSAHLSLYTDSLPISLHRQPTYFSTPTTHLFLYTNSSPISLHQQLTYFSSPTTHQFLYTGSPPISLHQQPTYFSTPTAPLLLYVFTPSGSEPHLCNVLGFVSLLHQELIFLQYRCSVRNSFKGRIHVSIRK